MTGLQDYLRSICTWCLLSRPTNV